MARKGKAGTSIWHSCFFSKLVEAACCPFYGKEKSWSLELKEVVAGIGIAATWALGRAFVVSLIGIILKGRKKYKDY